MPLSFPWAELSKLLISLQDEGLRFCYVAIISEFLFCQKLFKLFIESTKFPANILAPSLV